MMKDRNHPKAGLLSVLLLPLGTAHAALPEAATTAMTTLKTDAEALLTAAWPVVVAITVGFILIRLFKRVASRV